MKQRQAEIAAMREELNAAYPPPRRSHGSIEHRVYPLQTTPPVVTKWAGRIYDAAILIAILIGFLAVYSWVQTKDAEVAAEYSVQR